MQLAMRVSRDVQMQGLSPGHAIVEGTTHLDGRTAKALVTVSPELARDMDDEGLKRLTEHDLRTAFKDLGAA